MTTNDAMLRKLEELLDKREIPFHAKQNRIMCFPHTINIAVQHVLKKMTVIPDDEDDESLDEDPLPDSDFSSAEQRGRSQSFEEACAMDPIGKCRKIAVSIRASGQRRDEFENFIKNGNDKNWFKNAKNVAIKIPIRQVKRNVVTRWDSTYQMIKRSIELRPVILTLSFPVYIIQPDSAPNRPLMVS